MFWVCGLSFGLKVASEEDREPLSTFLLHDPICAIMCSLNGCFYQTSGGRNAQAEKTKENAEGGAVGELVAVGDYRRGGDFRRHLSMPSADVTSSR